MKIDPFDNDGTFHPERLEEHERIIKEVTKLFPNDKRKRKTLSLIKRDRKDQAKTYLRNLMIKPNLANL